MHIKIGELAKRAGLTIRTLHHYDQIGLLSPSLRSENGFRLYTQDDVIRLQRIQALKQFGCSLAEIKSFLEKPEVPLAEILLRQISSLDEQIDKAKILRQRLSRLYGRIAKGDPTKLPDWLTILEVMAIYEKRFSKEELDKLQENRIAGDLDRKWENLIAKVQKLIDQDITPTDLRAAKFAREWMKLVARTTGNDIALALKLRSLHQEETDIAKLTKITPQMREYMDTAGKAAKTNFFEGQTREPRHQLFSVPKQTALRVAQFRSIHQILDKPLIFEDPFAGKIIGCPPEKDLSKYNEPLYRGLRTSIVVRHRLAEDEWMNSYDRGLRQYVILGAGLDTFAFRHGSLDGLNIFEVDLPASLAWKRQCLKDAEMEPPSSLTFVETDFGGKSLEQSLKQAGFHKDQPAFFSWLGVTMYLDAPSIYKTLKYIISCARKSVILFDYCVDPSHLSPRELKAFQVLSQKVSGHQEPWKTFYDPEMLVEMLRSLGFTEISDFGPEEINKRYLADRTDGLRKSGVSRIIRAEI